MIFTLHDKENENLIFFKTDEEKMMNGLIDSETNIFLIINKDKDYDIIQITFEDYI